jgi:putative mycofactocin binding protein MftB
VSTDLISGSPAAEPTAQGDLLDGTWRLHEQVAVRPERFGALLYHFGTRRLSFVKDLRLLAILNALAESDSARDACLLAGIPDAELAPYRTALATLAKSHMIIEHRITAERTSA